MECVSEEWDNFVLVKHVEHTVQEVLISVHGIHGYNLFSYSRFEAHWELLRILPWSQVNGLDFPVTWVSRQFCQFVFCTKSPQLCCAAWWGEERQAKLMTAHPVWLFPLPIPPLLLVTAELVVPCPSPAPLFLKHPCTSDQIIYGPLCIIWSRDFCLILCFTKAKLLLRWSIWLRNYC